MYFNSDTKIDQILKVYRKQSVESKSVDIFGPFLAVKSVDIFGPSLTVFELEAF